MKRLLLVFPAALFLAACLAGCPVYSNDQGDYLVCDSSSCFDCPGPIYTSSCQPYSCITSYDCPNGYVCGGTGTCVSQGTGPGSPCALQTDCAAGLTCGADDSCHVSRCNVVGCSLGFLCNSTPAFPICVTSDGGVVALSDGGTDASSTDGGQADVSVPSADATTSDAGDGAVVEVDSSLSDGAGGESSTSDGSPGDAQVRSPCNLDNECVGVGSACINGQCAAQGSLCSATNACAVAADSCVGGRCVPACSAGAPCPTGYACDFAAGACSVNPSVCGAVACQGGSVCVEQHCLAPCSSGDAASSCPVNQICVNGGCLPDEHAL